MDQRSIQLKLAETILQSLQELQGMVTTESGDLNQLVFHKQEVSGRLHKLQQSLQTMQPIKANLLQSKQELDMAQAGTDVTLSFATQSSLWRDTIQRMGMVVAQVDPQWSERMSKQLKNYVKDIDSRREKLLTMSNAQEIDQLLQHVEESGQRLGSYLEHIELLLNKLIQDIKESEKPVIQYQAKKVQP